MTEPKKNTLMIIVGVVVVLFLLGSAGCLCLFGGTLMSGLGMVVNAEKTYYPECETLGDDGCSACCKKHGHSGQVMGNLLNDEGKTCGCL